jgi:glycosyltransferase involved in cell wall biosynthesis
MQYLPMSVVILTYNEEKNLPDCLHSLAWSDDIVIYDSYSTDKTTEIAEEAGCRIYRRNFDDYASQRNAALAEVRYKYPWLLMLDADERVTNEVFAELQHFLQTVPSTVALARLRRKDMFMGRWLRRSSGYPTWFARIMKVGHVTVKRAINEEYEADGDVVLLQSHLVHYPFNKGMNYWLERHNRYSEMEAAVLSQESVQPIYWHNLFSKDPILKRKALKHIAYKLPGRPLIVFLYLYVIRSGWLDGYAGFSYCMLRSIYEYLIDLKVTEIGWKRLGMPL